MLPRLAIVAITLLLVVAVLRAQGDGLDSIPMGRIVIDDTDYRVHIADEPRERSLGFQNVSAERVRESIIYFEFPRPRRPNFHMRNVTTPLAIAWIGPEGRVIGIDTMRPGRDGYRPPGPVSAALEMHPDRVEDLGLVPGVRIRRDGSD